MALTAAQHRNLVDRVNALMEIFRQSTQQREQSHADLMRALMEVQHDMLLQLLDKMAETEEEADAKAVMDEQFRNYNNSRGI
jgi:hypothetical protein